MQSVFSAHPFLRTREWNIMPLFQTWRHSSSTIHVQHKKGEPNIKLAGDANTEMDINQNNGQEIAKTKKAIFCSYDSSTDAKLMEMHEKQRAGDKLIQNDIDRYLVMCLGKSFSHMLLPKNGIPHYDNLPDIYKYAIGILDSSMDMDMSLQQVLLLLRQCIPLRRRTKRAQREVQWKTDSWFAMQTLVRCTQGTLFGLYPTSTQTVAFDIRVVIYQFIRTILVLDFSYLQMALKKLQYIVKLSIMEHLCNVITDYYPGICHTLNKSGQKVDHFCYSVSTICDIFRAEINSLFCARLSATQSVKEADENIRSRVWLDILPSLEKLAHSYFERCTRAYRGIIIGSTQSYRSIDTVKKMMEPDLLSMMDHLLESVHITPSQHLFDLIHEETLRQKKILDFAWHLTRIIVVKQLPMCIIENQLSALSRRYSGDTLCVTKCRLLNICFNCAIKKGSASGMKLRHDCQNGSLVCMYCESNSIVLTIDMLGNIVTICNDMILLSSCCGIMIRYTGNGNEFSKQCGDQCVHQRQFFKQKDFSKHASRRKTANKTLISDSIITDSLPATHKKMKGRHAAKSNVQNMSLNASLASTSSVPPVCEICAQRGAHQHLHLLDVPLRTMRSCTLCSKHSLPKQVSQYIYDVASLHAFHSANFAVGLGRTRKPLKHGLNSGLLSDVRTQSTDHCNKIKTSNKRTAKGKGFGAEILKKRKIKLKE